MHSGRSANRQKITEKSILKGLLKPALNICTQLNKNKTHWTCNKGSLRPLIFQTQWPSKQGENSLVRIIIWASMISIVPILCLFCYINSCFCQTGHCLISPDVERAILKLPNGSGGIQCITFQSAVKSGLHIKMLFEQ